MVIEIIFYTILYSFLAIFIIGILWALKEASDMERRVPHHDSLPGSYYYESNKRKD